MTKPNGTPALGIASACFILLSGCGGGQGPHGAELSPLVGQNCTVQFKRNSLGAGGGLPISPTTSSMNGAEVSVSGKVKQVGEDWIVMEAAKKGDLWIARSEILLIQPHGK